MIMNDQPVRDFLELLMPPYNNDHGVMIWTNLFNKAWHEAGNNITVFAVWHSKAPAMPFYDEFVIVRFFCSTPEQFMQAFQIENAADINVITPGRLFELYREGNALIECTVSHLYNEYSLNFSLRPPDKDVERDDPIVKVLLTTPEEFIQYTRQYYKLDEIPVTDKEKLECGVYKYLEDAEDLFQNKWGVEFSPAAKDPDEDVIGHSLTISAPWPSSPDHTGTTALLVTYEGYDVVELIETFGLTTADGLTDITPMQLKQLYYQGKACIYCWIEDEGDSLYFRLQADGSMLAADNYIGNDDHPARLHEVPELLETEEQFKEYTRQYWRYIRLIE